MRRSLSDALDSIDKIKKAKCLTFSLKNEPMISVVLKDDLSSIEQLRFEKSDIEPEDNTFVVSLVYSFLSKCGSSLNFELTQMMVDRTPLRRRCHSIIYDNLWFKVHLVIMMLLSIVMSVFYIKEMRTPLLITSLVMIMKMTLFGVRVLNEGYSHLFTSTTEVFSMLGMLELSSLDDGLSKIITIVFVGASIIKHRRMRNQVIDGFFEEKDLKLHMTHLFDSMSLTMGVLITIVYYSISYFN